MEATKGLREFFRSKDGQRFNLEKCMCVCDKAGKSALAAVTFGPSVGTALKMFYSFIMITGCIQEHF